jgi:Holliday junction resolvase RusA-like endonuclease
MIRVIVPGQPIAKGRVRVAMRGGKPCTYTPERTVNYEAAVAKYGAEAMDGRDPLEGPLQITVFAQFLTPKRGKKAGDWHFCKPDADNVLKCIDGLNGIVWRDDAQVASAQVVKTYANTPRLVIEVKPL